MRPGLAERDVHLLDIGRRGDTIGEIGLFHCRNDILDIGDGFYAILKDDGDGLVPAVDKILAKRIAFSLDLFLHRSHRHAAKVLGGPLRT